MTYSRTYNAQSEKETIDLDQYPILFNDEAHESRSDRYHVVRTIDPINVILDYGWRPVKVDSARTRRNGGKRGFQRHRVHFMNDSLPSFDGTYRRLTLTNAYDGTQAFQIEESLWRQICSNGLHGWSSFNIASVKHIGYATSKVEQAIQKVVGTDNQAIVTVQTLSTIVLSDDERRAFNRAALDLRLDGDKYLLDRTAEMTRYGSFGRPRRYEDTRNDLYTIMNVAQEKLLRTGFEAYKTDSPYYSTKVRAITNMAESDKLNGALFTLAQEMMKLKQE